MSAPDASAVADLSPQHVEGALVEQGGIPVVRAASADRAFDVCRRLVGAGLRVVELTTTTPGWHELLVELVRAEPAAVLGMGTVANADQAAAACEAGAAFLVSPFPAEGARRVSAAAGKLFVEGGFTPGEVAAASGRGLCKLFPAHLGGTTYLRTLTAILPGARIMPTGGIAVADVSAWLRAGATAVGVGGELTNAPDLEAAAAELTRQVATGRTP